ncbi:MAG TPA: 50S ribosomal protein L32e [Candidatus Aenigmarchaeota archaeon]|nr:50S ribosomal protein L32e [Candidatus Aenigmarchaeota archaeon]HEX32858.1 50S ribosomal protein L32e [Candidatus Aenigmarchaeota archaeon]
MKFLRVEHYRKKLGEKWRRPKAWHHNKARKRVGTKLWLVRIGYRSPKSERYRHPSGLYEVIVHNVNELKNVNPKTHCVRIAKIGKKKKKLIVGEAKKLGIKVLNPGEFK